jgi:Uma2 family endonuclease
MCSAVNLSLGAGVTSTQPTAGIAGIRQDSDERLLTTVIGELMATVEIPREQRFVLPNLSWAEYRAFANTIGERRIRLTYDRGKLEFMTLSHGHERLSNLLGRLIEIVTEELNRPIQSGGSTTVGREDLDRAIEPDQCYYLDNEPLVRDKDEIDLATDPPPDLVVEIGISRSSLNRMGIYAAFGVPEVWRLDGERLSVYQLADAGTYHETGHSRHFPHLPIAGIADFLRRRTTMDETNLVRAFRHWVRDQIARSP